VYLFIDESQDRERFVLAAVAAHDLTSLTTTIGRWRTASRNLNIAVREYHEADLHRDHPRLLTRLLEEMAVFKRKKRRPSPRKDLKVIAAYYLKAPSEQKGTALSHERLMTVYPETFRALVWALPLAVPAPIEVVCDQFEGCEKLLPALNIILADRAAGQIRFADSTGEKPLQLADLAAGTIRRYLGGEGNDGRFRLIAPLLHHLGAVLVKQ